MIITKDSKFIQFEARPMRYEEVEGLSNLSEDLINSIVYFEDTKYIDAALYYGTTKINDEYYYYKPIDDGTDYEMINELIGSYLARKINLRAVNYKIGIYDGNLYALSKIFYRPGFLYDDSTQLTDRVWGIDEEREEFLLNVKEEDILTSINNYNMLLKVLKLIALDLKMGQVDRYENLFFENSIKTGKTDLTPIIDFGFSYDDNKRFTYYLNPFIQMGVNVPNIRILIKKYPELMDYIKILSKINMKDILTDLQKENRILFTHDEIERYISLDRQYSKVLKRSVNQI